ncbi:MAG TPA: hypothetical protein VIX63_17490 [Vicinamibacterales bacterium]
MLWKLENAMDPVTIEAARDEDLDAILNLVAASGPIVIRQS